MTFQEQHTTMTYPTVDDSDYNNEDVKQEALPESIQLLSKNKTLEYLNQETLQQELVHFAKDLKNIQLETLVKRILAGIQGSLAIEELENWMIQVTSMAIAEEPEYSKLSARLLNSQIERKLTEQGLHHFNDSIAYGYKVGLINEHVYELVKQNSLILNHGILPVNNDLFEYFGLRTIYDRYLLKDPKTRKIIESPQYFFLRVACGLSKNAEEALSFYKLISSFEYMPSTPTLFNSGTKHQQLSSCYLLDSPQDSLEAIYSKYTDIALLSKFAGGIGVGFSRIRSRGSLIKGTNGKSNGIVPFLKTLDSSVAAVNQGGKRKGAACVYLETWHADIQEFLTLRENTGDESMRTHNLNLANWVPDLFMKRVQADQMWSLFDPSDVPHFSDLFASEFEEAYHQAEKQGLAKTQVKARELYGTMMKSLAQTGNGWMTFKDASNRKSNQTGQPSNVIHLSNLCTEILEVTCEGETAVCNLGSLNLGKYVKDAQFNFDRLAKNIKKAVTYLDRVIDINFYPISSAKSSNNKWRPVGLGIMGLQNVFFELKLSFDSKEAKELSKKIQEHVYFHALKTSMELAKEYGKHRSFPETRAAQGDLQFDLWQVEPNLEKYDWNGLKEEIKTYGLRNSLLVAIAPTATIASITGAYECIEPQLSNLFKRETLSGEFLQINPYLVRDLRNLGLWNKSIRDEIKIGEGSIQHIVEIPSELKKLYRTVWEIPQRSLIDMAADRGAFIDQSQSLNLFLEAPTLGKVSSMYAHAWKKGLKTTYYLRSRGATSIQKTTVDIPKVSTTQAIACSLENPESCESCT